MTTEEKDFNFAITTLAGCRLFLFLRLSFKYGIEKKYLRKWFNCLIVSAICSFLGLFDRFAFALKKAPHSKPPVFILGHWRSGTTYLHNLMCLDPEAAYCTTYQTVFPNNLFAFQWLLKPAMAKNMPEKRPVDNVRLGAELPQEEEFALNNETPYSHYNWWFFPQQSESIVDEYLLGNTKRVSELSKFKKNYQRFVARCLVNTQGTRFISKNPPNTARIKILKELFPNAKFIYIHRNPYEVIYSSLRFFKSVLPGTQFQEISDDELTEIVLNTYKKMISQYEMDKEILNEGNLLEVQYLDLISNPADTIKNIYQEFLAEDYARVEPFLKDKLGDDHKIKDYKFERDFIDEVNNSLGPILEKLGYDIL